MISSLHHNIIRASGNQLLCELFQATSHMMDLFILDMRRKLLVDPHTRELLQETHNNIAAALSNHNGTLLEAAYERHFLLVDEAIEASLSKGKE